MPEIPETTAPRSRPRLESWIWPPWLPVQARLPLIAQITGAIALAAAVMMPRWTDVTRAADVPTAPMSVRAVSPAPAPAAPRPAHLNLDVRHKFGSVDLTIAVDDKRAFTAKLPGSGKRFGVFGGRAERGFTKTLDLEPGARVVRVRLQSAADKFDQTRVERFDLDPAAVATLTIAADKAGLSVVAERPPARPVAAPAPVATPAVAPVTAEPARQAVAEASALSELYHTLRSVLIALAGFIASAATGFLVQEFLRRRKLSMFAEAPAGTTMAPAPAEKRRRRSGRRTPDMPAGAAG